MRPLPNKLYTINIEDNIEDTSDDAKYFFKNVAAAREGPAPAGPFAQHANNHQYCVGVGALIYLEVLEVLEVLEILGF
jgi:hypothetical protein